MFDICLICVNVLIYFVVLVVFVYCGVFGDVKGCDVIFCGVVVCVC